MTAEFPSASLTPFSPWGLRLSEAERIDERAPWREGKVEVQDEGSQLVCLACDARPGMTVIDLCAGAGGKTLALAAQMDGAGRLVAADVDRARLRNMPDRLERAGISDIEMRLLDPGRELDMMGDLEGKADLVLVDAPCSGTGTWRRNPDLRWRLDEARLERLVKLQSHLLDLAERLVAPGGALVYAICSLLAEEGRGQAEAFTDRSSLESESLSIPAGRPAGKGHLLTPVFDGTDGFFIARWRRP